MESLFWFLLAAGAFYLIMRFRWGADKIHGKTVENIRDPVCGMEVAGDTGYAKMYKGQQYRFCSHICLEKFDTDPERFLTPMKTMANSRKTESRQSSNHTD
jgi:YHS domain-containing protein